MAGQHTVSLHVDGDQVTLTYNAVPMVPLCTRDELHARIAALQSDGQELARQVVDLRAELVTAYAERDDLYKRLAAVRDAIREG